MTRHLIIDRPDLQSWRQRAVFGSLTVMFWMLWLLLWLPLITLLGWLFFGFQVNLQMVDFRIHGGTICSWPCITPAFDMHAGAGAL